jgi:Zn-dependent peptidase ImmA (M78 family)
MSYPQSEIIEKARQLLVRLWRKRDQIWLTPPSVEALFPLQPEIIVKDILAVEYEEPIEIPTLASLRQEVITTDTAGFIDRENNRIVVAQNFKAEWRRFTIAHEIGHWILHPAGQSFRHRPITGAERANPTRPVEEREADLFAAELLMPRKILKSEFNQRFGVCLDGSQPDQELAFWLSAGLGRDIDMIELAKNGTSYRAFLISGLSSFRGRHFIPLADRFGVSLKAMAIQLEKLGLVK